MTRFANSLLAAPDPRVTGRYVLAQQKNNLAPLQPSLAYTLPDDGPRLQWLGESVWRAEDLGRRRPRPLLQRACEFLRAFLETGARPVDDIWEAAKAAGISEATLRRAKKESASAAKPSAAPTSTPPTGCCRTKCSRPSCKARWISTCNR